MKKSSRNIVIWGRIFSTGLHNLLRNVWLSSAATAVMVVTLSVLLLSWVVNMSLSETIDARTNDFSVGLYFNDNVDQTLLSDLRSEIEAKDYVEEVKYISKEQALDIFLQRGEEENDDSIAAGLEVVGENITPASFDIRFNDLSKVDNILAYADSDKYSSIIYDTSDNKVTRKSIDQYITIQDSLHKATLATIVIFGAIAALIVFNTIRMAVFSRSDEIEIMKLIGATPNYIRGPFLVEAMLYGVVAALLAFSVAYSVLSSVLPSISGLQSEETIAFFSNYWVGVFGLTVLVGVLIGLLSSLLATEKYLKLKRW